MKCNQCEFLYINGVGCHETGCPNITRKVKCFYCGSEIADVKEGCDCREDSTIMAIG